MNIDKLKNLILVSIVSKLDQPFLRVNILEVVSMFQLLVSVEIHRCVITLQLRVHSQEGEHLINFFLFYRHFLSIIYFVKDEFNWIRLMRNQLFPSTDGDVEHKTFWSDEVLDVRKGKDFDSETSGGVYLNATHVRQHGVQNCY